MKRILISLLAIVVLGFLAYTIYYLKTSPSKAKLTGIDVLMHAAEQGREPFMGEEDVRLEMERKGLNLKGLLLDSIDVGAVERTLRQNPLFSDVEVYITPRTARMKVEVKQKEALFLVNDHRGRTYYVSSDRGTIPMNPRYTIYVPIVTGTITEEQAKTEIYDLVTLIKQDDYFRNYFGQIHLDPQEGLILVPRVGSTPVYLGKSRDYARMLHKYKVFTQEVFPRTGDKAYSYIKLAYGDQVVVRPRYKQTVADSIVE